MHPEELRDEAPSDADVTDYDHAHLRTYLRILDADAADASWQEVVMRLFNRDPAVDSGRLERTYRTHLERAKWMRDGGYLQLLHRPPG